MSVPSCLQILLLPSSVRLCHVPLGLEILQVSLASRHMHMLVPSLVSLCHASVHHSAQQEQDPYALCWLLFECLLYVVQECQSATDGDVVPHLLCSVTVTPRLLARLLYAFKCLYDCMCTVDPPCVEKERGREGHRAISELFLLLITYASAWLCH